MVDNSLKQSPDNDDMVKSTDPQHPANLIPSLCKVFWNMGWVTGTGGGASIRDKYVRIGK
jgi:methylthioribulose-1-phosphate dehydratase